MAKILVIRHGAEPTDLSHHAIAAFVDLWSDAGHSVEIIHGIRDLPAADLAVLHVDLSVVPPSFREAVKHYPRVINGAAVDIRKRRVSRNLIGRDSDWRGRVIVKSDLNCSGWPEWRMRGRFLELGRDLPEVREPINPKVYRSLAMVPDEVWADPFLVVERFIAERDGDNFAIRHWIFLGDRERCKRCLSPNPIIKGLNIVAVEDAPVPDEIRAERVRLGLDFGKMDFIVRDGRPVLFDANKTPGPVPDSAEGGLPEHLAGGIDAFLAETARTA